MIVIAKWRSRCGLKRTFGHSTFVCIRHHGHHFDRHIFIRAER